MFGSKWSGQGAELTEPARDINNLGRNRPRNHGGTRRPGWFRPVPVSFRHRFLRILLKSNCSSYSSAILGTANLLGALDDTRVGVPRLGFSRRQDRRE